VIAHPLRRLARTRAYLFFFVAFFLAVFFAFFFAAMGGHLLSRMMVWDLAIDRFGTSTPKVECNGVCIDVKYRRSCGAEG
jgi:hypothetical protein